MGETAPKDAARWMLEQLEEGGGMLYQEDAVYRLAETFGESVVRTNEAGNLAVAPSVLREFRRLTEDTVVWSRSDLAWRWRHEGDSLGSRQTD